MRNWAGRWLLAACALALVAATSSPAPGQAQTTPTTRPPIGSRVPASEIRAGQELFQVACSSCHGINGEGAEYGPSLVGVGAASADFFLTTGRMPLDDPGRQPVRKKPAYTDREIRQLVAYVASLGAGLPIPQVDPNQGQLPQGYKLYADNCASCHSSAGAGGALGRSVYAPPLDDATPTQVAEAVRIGPGAMPVFGPDILDDRQLASLVRYVEYLKDPEDRGGLPLGHLGPIPEGFVAWVVGMGLLVVALRWIGTRD